MNEGQGTVARAFELARSGECDSVAAIRGKLAKEGFPSISDHLDGLSIKRQLGALIKGGKSS
jgi:hypothetical protein